MSQAHKPVRVEDNVGALAQFVRTLRLVWRLLFDARVSFFPKLIIPAAIVYIVSPIDLIPDVILGLGQMDDVAVAFLAIRLFIELCPAAIVEEHRAAIAAESGRTNKPPAEDVVEGSFRVVSDDERKSNK
jgi:uncharacterized membrane protein YkvA (DUF1232 family)